MKNKKQNFRIGGIQNREHRRLEIKLDNLGNRFELPLLTNLDTGEETSNFAKPTLPPFINSSPVYTQLNCDYYLKCAELNIKCNIPCQSMKFFDRYGMERYLQMGIGGRL